MTEESSPATAVVRVCLGRFDPGQSSAVDAMSI
jgi:hypothetical protein